MKDQIAKVRINLFRSLFKGREDAYGAGRGVCVRKPLTDEVILKHLQGKQRIGVYPLLHGDTVHTTIISPNRRLGQGGTSQ